MSEKTYKMTELVGTSSESVEHAIGTAVSRAAKTVRNMAWFEVKEIRGGISDGKVVEYQVRFTVGFRLEDKK